MRVGFIMLRFENERVCAAANDKSAKVTAGCLFVSLIGTRPSEHSAPVVRIVSSSLIGLGVVFAG